MFYFVRVFFVSLEFLILCLFALFLFNYENRIIEFFGKLTMNDEFYKYLIFAPILLCVWIFTESKNLVFSDAEQKKILVNWPLYFKLKTHIVVSCIYGVVFVCVGLMPLLFDVKKILLYCLATSVIGTLIVAISIYFAQMKIQEILSTEYANS